MGHVSEFYPDSESEAPVEPLKAIGDDLRWSQEGDSSDHLRRSGEHRSSPISRLQSVARGRPSPEDGAAVQRRVAPLFGVENLCM